MVHAPWDSQNEIVFADWSYIESDLLHVFVHGDKCDMDLLIYGEEFVTGDSLELEFRWMGLCQDSKFFYYSGMDKVAHCSRVNEHL